MTTEQTARLLEGAAQAIRARDPLLAGQLAQRGIEGIEEIARERVGRLEHVSKPISRVMAALASKVEGY